MTASSIAVNVRGALKTAISSVAANVYDAVPEAPIVPFAAVVPSFPYLESTLIGRSSVKVKVNLRVVLGVASYSNAASLDNIEQLAISILAAIPSGYTIGSVSNPIPQTIGASEILACELEVSCYYTQTN
ncbi:hypothetical protein UFOVP1406_5 [uncultured Caudovirales phage]|uniref:Tail completion protein n=1 Tax=uncultured Caudovirales phage TaxID=2100421 RepID=A0A6J5S7X1_9CAUD|nr:hypothetical protein UFOVP1406_5 [uncultured Caudovirales phage]